MSKKKLLVIGITGQDGSYLAEILLRKKLYRFTEWLGDLQCLTLQRIDHILSTSRDNETT